MNKIVCLDFDGVIHLNRNFIASTIINDEPVPGVREAINHLRETYRVVVHSCRCNTAGGVDAIKDWLDLHGIDVDNVVNYKPHAAVYIDDKAVTFDGDWSDTVARIEQFETWQHDIKQINKSMKSRFKKSHRQY